jgi:sortase A
MFGKKHPENLSVEELEKLLLIKRRQSRVEKFKQMSAQGQTINETLFSAQKPAPAAKKTSPPKVDAPPKAPRTLRDSLLLTLEVVALAGLVGVLVASYFNLKELNNEVAEAQQMVVESQMLPTTTPTPPIALAILPGGHSPPTASQGAMPDIPAHLQQWVQPQSGTNAAAPNLKVDQSVNPPTRIVVPKINVDAPIVADVSWEALKMGVGHLPGSANPGERGNLYLAAHNDIFGEIFRYLDDLEPGDEYFIYSGEENFRYVVKEKRIIDPTDVEVMWPTTEPVATLQTCYPYLVDTHRLVIIGELAE